MQEELKTKLVRVNIDEKVWHIITYFEDTTDYEKLFNETPTMTVMFSNSPEHGFKLTFE